MAVRFILGRAGAGKTHWCLQRITQALRQQPLGPSIFFLLPRQATFQAQRQLACQSGLGGFFRARVISFDDLGREIMAECGGTAVPQITERGRRMILAHLLRKNADQLTFFKSVAHQPGVAAELDKTFSELECSGHDASAIQAQLADSSAAISPALSAKIHDLGLIYGQYIAFLGQDRLDPNRRLTEALASIERCQSLRDADVYVDSFLDFTASERQVLAALAKVCRSVSITLTIDPASPTVADPHHLPDEMSLFHRTEDAYRRLWFTLQEAGVAVSEPVALSEARRFENESLAALERWKGDAIAGGTEAIELIEAPDRRAEVDAAARWIRELAAGSMRYRDIAVLMRDETEYRDLIEASFGEHGIAYFLDHRRTAAHHPLLRLIRAAIAVAENDWPHEAMMAILKSGLVGLTHADADALENYVLLHGIRRQTWIAPEPWTGRRQPADESEDAAVAALDVARIDALRRQVVSRLGPFVCALKASPRLPVRSLAKAVFDLLEAFACAKTISTWMEEAAAQGRLEERGQHERVWDELVQLFDELVDLFGPESMTPADFSALLDSALEGFDLALTPPTVDQVLVGPVDRTRTPPIKACVVLGLSDGQFPHAWREGTVFSDEDRRVLGNQNIDLDPDTTRRLLDEHFLGYIAFTRASQRLLLTRAIADRAGRAAAGSSLWQRVTARFPDLSVTSVPRERDLPMELIATPRQLVTSLMRWVRSDGADESWAPLYQWLATHETCDDAVDVARYRAWKALSSDNAARLDPDRAAALFTSPLRAGIGQLESFRSCPYQHFARFGLGLLKREERAVTGQDLVHAYRDVLHKMARQLIQSRQSWSDLDDAAADRRIAELTGQLARRLGEELMLSTPRNRYLLDRVERTLHAVVAAQKAAATRGQFRPGWAGVRFEDGSALPGLELRTPAGNEVRLSGTIDRIDVLRDGSACVVDYRLETNPLDATRAFHGLSLRLLAFLLVLEKNGRDLTGGSPLMPAAAFGVQLLRKIRDADPRDALSPDDPRFNLLVKPRGIFDVRCAQQLDGQLSQGTSDVVQLHINKDGSIGRSKQSDAVPGDQFSALLRHVERRMGELADGILGGRIEIRPYRMGKETPCPRCEFRALCRFEPSPGCYDDLQPMNRDEMLERVVER